MRRGRGNVWGVWILVCVMAVMAGRPLTVFGATKTVSSITIRVGTDTKAGEMLNENIAVYAAVFSSERGVEQLYQEGHDCGGGTQDEAVSGD